MQWVGVANNIDRGYSMAWLRVHQSLVNHRKTLAAAHDLNIPTVYLIGHLVTLWLWCIDNAPDGDLTNISSQDIALIAQWGGDPDLFLNAITGNETTRPRFLERIQGRLQIHDWYDYTGKLIEQREANKERMRAARAKHKYNTVQQQFQNGVGLDESRVEKSRVEKSITTGGVVDIHERNFGPIGMPSEALQEVFIALGQFDIREVEETYAQARTHNPPLKFPAGWVLSVLQRGSSRSRDRPQKEPPWDPGPMMRERAAEQHAEIERITAEMEARDREEGIKHDS